MPVEKEIRRDFITLKTDTGSAVDTLVTLATPTGDLRRITSVKVNYSAAVSLDVTITFKSGVDSKFDVVEKVHTLSVAKDLAWYPNGDLDLDTLDALEVKAPAGGATIEGAVTIKSEVY